MKKVLHLSHHYGCLKDHQYVCNELGLDLTNKLSIWNQIVERDHYVISKEYANSVWQKNKDYFNSFDFVITSDTAPLSRIFLENIQEFTGQLIIWICNRFNYDMTSDAEYHSLFDSATRMDNVRVIPYTEFERVWAKHFNIQIEEDVIRPIGYSIDTPLSNEECKELIGFGGDYGQELKGGDVLISRYHNDNLFQDSIKMFDSYGLVADVCKYQGYSGLIELSKKYSAYFILPEQYSKLAAFELMGIGLPVILPSEQFLFKLSRQPNYWFGSGLYQNTVQICEWYNEYFDKFAVYIDDFSEIPEAFRTVVSHREEICAIMLECSKTHKEKTLQQWRKIYNV
jgi:hypothetical protein